MGYEWIKIFHVVSASLFCMGIGYALFLWKSAMHARNFSQVVGGIQLQTGYVIIPCAIFQLTTGFTMISLKHYNLSEAWIIGSVISFLLVIASWLGFIYFLVLTQQLRSEQIESHFLRLEKYRYFRGVQSILLGVCVTAICSMIFLMANRVA